MTDKFNLHSICHNVSIFLFGSALYSNEPNDIDLLVIYNEKMVKIPQALNFRKNLRESIFDSFLISAHICLLSSDEIEHQCFIEQESAIEIYPKEPNKAFHRKVFSAALQSFR